MQRLHRLFDFYLDASIHVAFAIVALVMATSLLLNIPFDFHLVCFLFFGSISCYNFVKYGPEAEKYLKLTNLYHKNIQFFSIVCLLIAVDHAFFLKTETWVGIIILVLMTGLYAVPVLPRAKNLRSWSGLKIFIVAGVWAGTTVILPCLEVGQALSWDIYIETGQRFLLVLILILPFEIRDLRYDARELQTLPQIFGVRRTKIFGLLLTAIFFIGIFLKDSIEPGELFEKGILSGMLIMALLLAKQRQSQYFASFWVEGIPIVWVVWLWVTAK
ncbi:hypothetical protein FGM00_13725 [Aggregatimonas sangjinii]|uniref:Prenyltransferase n=1 Tax=Aggregatimonas sangjinii TaxID=2583587 RepID=A0A5B7SWI6_9FLAO|nr:hypothetical protein [Aggregatimonas sangjinii]QCX01120.1 hypothetical protein FGM00_13725 [Aggregatimonas sangjinii]